MKSQPPQLSSQHNCFSKFNELHFTGQYRGGGGGGGGGGWGGGGGVGAYSRMGAY